MTEAVNQSRQWATQPELWEKLKPLAREKRQQPTPAEVVLWQCLRNRQLNGLKFRRQHPIERFIVDFFCSDLRLVIEVDGGVHQYSVDEDAIRQAFLESQRLQVLRFTNDDVLNSIVTVLARIAAVCPLSEIGEGDRG